MILSHSSWASFCWPRFWMARILSAPLSSKTVMEKTTAVSVAFFQSLSCGGEVCEPALPPEERSPRGYTTDRVLIDACRPFKWIDEFPAVNAFTKSYKDQIGRKFNI